MRSCGIVVEYNPFHNGHLYHAKQAREQSQADVVVAVMSGNFLQRGEPAIIDKWARAAAALANGVDLVVELPTEWAVQSADYFARGAVQVLQALNCDTLCFGTDGDTQFDYAGFGAFVQQHQKDIDQAFSALAETGWTYPKKMNEVFRQLYPELELNATSPNHILGLSYSKENASYSQPMSVIPLERTAAGYHDQEAVHEEIASATAIRKLLQEGKETAKYVPPAMLASILTTPIVTWENYWPLLRYRILASSLEELRLIYQMSEGLEARIQTCARQADSFAAFIEALKTKRYTWTRLQRLCCYLLLNVKTTDIHQLWEQPSIHILGFTDAGRTYLNQQKKTIELPVFSKVGREEQQQLALTLKADSIYQLGNSQIQEQNFGRSPLLPQQ